MKSLNGLCISFGWSIGLSEAVLTRLRHINDWRGPGELTKAVADNCTLCLPQVPTVAAVREALEVLVGEGLATPDGRGRYRTSTPAEIEQFLTSPSMAVVDEGRVRRRATVMALALLLEGTPAGGDLAKVAEELWKS